MQQLAEIVQVLQYSNRVIKYWSPAKWTPFNYVSSAINANKFEEPWLLQANPSRKEMTIDLRDLDKSHKECLSISCSNHILSRQGPLIFNNHKDLGEDSNHTICSNPNKLCGSFDFNEFTHTNITSVPSSLHQKLINSCILLAF